MEDARDNANFPPNCTLAKKRAIIQVWQERLAPFALQTLVCAVCAWDCLSSELQDIDPHCVDLKVLRNDLLSALTCFQQPTIDSHTRMRSFIRWDRSTVKSVTKPGCVTPATSRCVRSNRNIQDTP